MLEHRLQSKGNRMDNHSTGTFQRQPMKNFLACSFVLSVALFARPSWADLPALPPCVTQAVGAACTTTGSVAGTCQCTASGNVQGNCYHCPTSATSDFSTCIVCQPVTSPGTGGSPTGVDAGSPPSTGKPGTSPGTGGSTTGVDAGSPPSTNDSGACTVGKGSAAKNVAPWLMAGAFSILFLFRRRRAR